jgi:ubiquinone/menaquinone biosynthesis C-methylase UbiE
MAFAKHSAEVVGFDATDAFIELARAEAAQRGLRNVRFQHGDAEQLPFSDGHFDIVSCRAAFHHFSRPARVLAEMIRVLATAGRVVVADLLGSEEPVESCLADDRAGLRVRREGGRLRFSHHGAAFVLERPIETAP